MSLTDLPNDIIGKEIFSNIKDLEHVARANKKLYQIYSDNIQNIVNNKYLFACKPNDISWHRFYKFLLNSEMVPIYNESDRIAFTYVTAKNTNYATSEVVKIVSQNKYNIVFINVFHLPVLIVSYPDMKSEHIPQIDSRIDKIIVTSEKFESCAAELQTHIDLFKSVTPLKVLHATVLKKYNPGYCSKIRKILASASDIPIYHIKFTLSRQEYFYNAETQIKLPLYKSLLHDAKAFRKRLLKTDLNQLKSILSKDQLILFRGSIASVFYPAPDDLNVIKPYLDDYTLNLIKELFSTLDFKTLNNLGFFPYNKSIDYELSDIARLLNITPCASYSELIPKIKTYLATIGHSFVKC